MASLGNLSFEILFQSDPKQLEEIKKRALEQLKDIEVKFDIKTGVSKEDLAKEIEQILAKDHKVNVSVDKEKLSKDVNDALSKTATSTQDTQAVVDQAGAYKELESAINSIIGTRGQNIKRLTEEKTALESVQSQLRLLEKQRQSGIILNKDQLASKASLINKEHEHKQAISELNQLIKSDVKLSQSASTSMDEMSLNLGRMRVAYRGLSEEMRNSDFGKGLQKQIDITDKELKKLDASIGNHQRNVGNYSSHWDGLSNSIQQVAREFPSLAYGPKVFFSAISNNLPILSDQLKKARVEYDALKASGQKAVPVWKQVAASLFSWQTALVAGITLLTLYGDKLVNWIFKTERATKVQDDFIKSLKDGNDEYTKAYEDLARLEGILSNIDGKFITTKDALDEYNQSIGKNIGSTQDLNTAQQNLINKKDAYLDVIIQEALAHEHLAEAAKLASKEVGLRMKETFNWREKLWTVLNLKPGAETKQFMDWVNWGGWDQAMAYKNAEKADKLNEKQLKEREHFFKATKKLNIMAAAAGIDLFPDQLKDKKANEPLKERISLLKEAYSAYREISSLAGKNVALNIIHDTISPGFDPDKYREEIQEIFDNKSVDASIRADAAKILIDLDKDTLSNELKETETYIKKTIASWDLFNELFKKTGNYNLSANIAFGGDVAYESVIDQLMDNIQYEIEKSGKNISIDDLILMPESDVKNTFGANMSAYVNAYKEQNKKIKEDTVKTLADLLAETKTYEQKRDDIVNKWSKITGDTSLGETERGIAQNKMDEEIASLDFDQLKNTELWVKVFDDLDRVSGKTLNQMIAQLEEFSGTASKLPVNQFREYMNILKKIRGESESRNPLKSLVEGFKDLGKAVNSKDADGIQAAQDKISDAAKEIVPYADQIGNALGSLSEMFDSMGNESMANAMDNAQEAFSSISNIGQGFAKGGLIGGIGAAVGEAAKWIGKIAQSHDAKLDKAIIKSQQEAQRLQNIYESIERQMERFLGDGREFKPWELQEDEKKLNNIRYQIDQIKAKGTLNLFDLQVLQEYSKEADKLQKRLKAFEEGGAYGYQRALLEDQLKELEKQRKAEEGKRKSRDEEKIEEYKKQEAELKDQLSYFAEDLANSLYGIDFKGWASQLSDALVDAFANGEDAAKAFDDTVADIMRSVISEMINIGVLQPMFEDLRNYLFGADGKSGAFGKDLELQSDEAAKVGGMLDKISEKGIPAAKELWDSINAALGGSLSIDKESGGGLASGIKGITEDTASILASYANSMRADGAQQLDLFKKYIDSDVPRMNALAQAQLTQLQSIAANTYRNADTADEIMDLLKRNTNPKGFKIG